MKRFFADLLLGVRLAAGGGRGAWVRLVLTGMGIGLGVLVLLVGATVPSIMENRNERQAARSSVGAEPGTPPERILHSEVWSTQYRGENITAKYLRAGGPQAPVPPGIPKVPADGEMYVSPALADMLADPDNGMLRELLPQKVVGAIADEGLNAPRDLVYFAGDASVEATEANSVGRFGDERTTQELPPFLLVLVLTGCVVLLFPVLVFVGVSTRLAGAQRDRRLAALRLVGAGAGRVRLIAAGEALVGSLVGLVVGVGLFLVGRRFAEGVELLGVSVFAEELSPSPVLAVVLAALIPVLAVVTSLLAMRRTVVEPLGVVRQTKPVRRRLWWRIVPVLLGVGVLISQAGGFAGERITGAYREELLVAGIALLLLGIPALLPWALERSVQHAHRGAPSWQLAMRRLQLDSGTAARVVGGVAVVLAGAIALQTVLTSVQSKIPDGGGPALNTELMQVSLRGDEEGQAEEQARAIELLEGAEGVQEVFTPVFVDLKAKGASPQDGPIQVGIAPCALLLASGAPECVDGQAYEFQRDADVSYWKVQPGAELGVLGPWTPETAGMPSASGEYVDEREPLSTWRAPEVKRLVVPEGSNLHSTYLTPGAARDLAVPPGVRGSISIALEKDADAANHVRVALAPMAWRVYTYYFGDADLSMEAKQYQQIKGALFAGALIVLLLAAASLLVVALEQIKERRRPLAVLAASGVPRGALARSLLWQNAVPLVLAVLVAIATGAGLGALLLGVIERPVELDWSGIAQFSGAALVLGLLVTALTLPSLRKATGALGLRTE
ncbi:FtsX-like permease family protein [Actinosynnema pretiosum]|uniref:ABC3 transporter permease C-terminal domain-containing protein n=1 Tax=Actinosynnema pretiosum TaxID=42197 RepID=A0A290ZEZ1_9PSEU|nr:FtsX-like permease family protein [Actinosynnema pretiosum]ATE57610.1 hypothetical protein CNX65_33440 [Actinosynnema pretiosum]